MKNNITNCLKAGIAVIIVLSATGFDRKPVMNISTAAALEKYGRILKDQSFFLIPELRENPLTWFDSIPEKRLMDGYLPKSLAMSAQPGEYYVYQVGCWALHSGIDDISVTFTDLKSNNGKIIPSGRMTCFNKGGINFMGSPFTKKVSIPAGRVQTLWMGIDLSNMVKGTYAGSVTVTAGGVKQSAPLRLNISGDPVPDHGYNEGKRLSRLSWLNSTVGIDDSISRGYIPVKLEGNTVSILGRSLRIAGNGLPASIVSYFGPSNQSLVDKGEELLDSPFRFIIEKEDGVTVSLKPGEIKILSRSPSRVVRNVVSTSDEFVIDCPGQMEFEGFVGYKLKLSSKVPVRVKDIRLEIPMNKDKALYMMGLNHEGGYKSPEWKWKWDVSR